MAGYSEADNVRDAAAGAEDVPRHQHHAGHRDRTHPRRGARRRFGTGCRVRHRRRRRGGDFRVHRNQARHPAGDDLAVRPAEDRRLGGARAVSHRRCDSMPRGRRTSASSTRWCRWPSSTPPSPRYVSEALSASPTAVARAKALIPRVLGQSPADVMAITAEAIAAQRVSPEGQDGLTAFLDQGHARLGGSQVAFAHRQTRE